MPGNTSWSGTATILSIAAFEHEDEGRHYQGLLWFSSTTSSTPVVKPPTCALKNRFSSSPNSSITIPFLDHHLLTSRTKWIEEGRPARLSNQDLHLHQNLDFSCVRYFQKDPVFLSHVTIWWRKGLRGGMCMEKNKDATYFIKAKSRQEGL